MAWALKGQQFCACIFILLLARSARGDEQGTGGEKWTRSKVGESGCRQNRPQLLRLDGHLMRQLLLRALPLLRYGSNQPVHMSGGPLRARSPQQGG
jgi:hypothetical protein